MRTGRLRRHPALPQLRLRGLRPRPGQAPAPLVDQRRAGAARDSWHQVGHVGSGRRPNQDPPSLRPGQGAPPRRGSQGLVALPPRRHAGHGHVPHAHHSGAHGRGQACPARHPAGPAPGRRRGPLACGRSPVRALALRRLRPCDHVLLEPGPVGNSATNCPRGAAPLPQRVHGRSGR